jgi:hypothetical protein
MARMPGTQTFHLFAVDCALLWFRAGLGSTRIDHTFVASRGSQKAKVHKADRIAVRETKVGFG